MENSKRPGENNDEEYSSKRSRGSFMLKQLIPHHVSGVIIGEGGSTIMAFQKNTGTQIKMSKTSDFFPGTSDRVLVISGAAENVIEAHQGIWAKIRQKSQQNSDLKINVVIPHQVVGLIIGKNGAQVKKIKESSNAAVHISPKGDNPRILERIVTIAGVKEEDINEAFNQIFKILKDEPNSSMYPNENYSEIMNFVSSNQAAMSSLAINPYAHSYGGLNIPNLNNCNVSLNSQHLKGYQAIDSVRFLLRGAGYNAVSVEQIVQALVILSQHNLLPNGEQQGLVTLESLVTLMKGANISYPVYNMAEGSEYMNQQSGIAPANQEANAIQGPQLSDVMYVSEALVGAILGPAGRNLVDIQRATMTSIVISKKGDFAPGTTDRIVTVMGHTEVAIQMAVQMMNDCIRALEKARKHK